MNKHRDIHLLFSKMALFLSTILIFSLLFISCSPKEKGCENCPPGTSCHSTKVGNKLSYYCLKEIKLADIGGNCFGKNENCLSKFCYTPTGASTSLSYCSTECLPSVPCPKNFECQSVLIAGTRQQICVRRKGTGGGKTGEGCHCGKSNASCSAHGHSDCDEKAGYFCLSTKENDPKAVCTKRCKIGEKGTCQEGEICTPTSLGLPICIPNPYTPGDIGHNCAKAGKAECLEGAFCYSQWPGDPDAFCTKNCNPYREGSCGRNAVCDSPREQDPYICIPRGTKKIGENCAAKGFLECYSGICVKLDPRSREAPFCTRPCSPSKEDCPSGFRCHLFGHLYRYLCAKSTGGILGSICNKGGNADCKSKICIRPNPKSINRICSQKCDSSHPCPIGYVCDNSRQVCIPKTGKKSIGEPCNAPQECIFGTCVTDTQNRRFCTQRCTEDSQCPEGYSCRHLEYTQRYCLPKVAGNKKLGEPCPNGPGDCQSRSCIADVIKNRSFCTQSCQGGKPCPPPYICTKFSDKEAYCTPKDYQKP